MQYKKEEIRNRIIKAAKEEFIKKGYQKASIRKIAAKAEISVSNIYNYFNSKNEIFEVVLQPLFTKVEFGKKYLMNFDLQTSDIKVTNLKEHQEFILKAAKFVEKNRELISLLLFKSSGSNLADYKEKIMDWYVDYWFDYIEKADSNIEVNEYSVRNIAGVWYNLLEEVVRYEITGQDLEDLVAEMTIYVFGGWNQLVDWKRKE